MLHGILNSIDEAIHVVNDKGMTIYYNHVAAKHDGLEVNEVLGKYLLEVFPSLTTETSTLLKVIETAQPIYNQHQTYMNNKGQLIDTVNTTIPIIVDRKLVGAVEIAKDITKVRELSEKLLDLEARYQQKNSKKRETKTETPLFRFTDIITNNKELEAIKQLALKASQTTSTILVYGETGTGKELLVQAIHQASPRKEMPFIAQNCAAIPPTLLEGILFGTVKGSFTGAIDRPGLFELANGGTLFLDEINSMPLEIQAKLLRVLQDGVVRRVGATKGNAFDVRVICATNEPPQVSVENNQLRSDLYYRINVMSLRIPPLRERIEDIPRLVEHFLHKFNFRFQKLITDVDEEVTDIFLHYPWPGNVRELEHTIEAAMNVVEGDKIKREHLPYHLLERLPSRKKQTKMKNKPTSLRAELQRVEQELIHQALEESKGNIQQAAKLLRIPRQTLQYKLSKEKK